RRDDFLGKAANPQDGGWRYSPQMPGDTSVFGWVMFALRSARLASLTIPKGTLRGSHYYLDVASTDKRRTSYSYRPQQDASPVMTAEALLCRQYLGWPRDYPALVKGAGLVSAHLHDSDERNIYYWYYATQMLHNMQGNAWKRWNQRVRDGLVAMQVVEKGCTEGSWDPLHPQPDRWARAAG